MQFTALFLVGHQTAYPPILENNYHPPPLSLWVSMVNDIMRMEKMLALDNDTYEKIKVLWLIWTDFSTSDSLKNMLAPHGQHGNTSWFHHTSLLHQGLLNYPLILSPLALYLNFPPFFFLSSLPFSPLFFLFLCLTPNPNFLFPNSNMFSFET